MRGKFITFEGGEGSGKTTILEMLSKFLMESGEDFIITREPGGVKISESIREIILDKENINMDYKTEALLYAASRAQILKEKINPTLESNKHVLCDRFVDSSLVYQGIARGLGIENVLKINEFALTQLPDITIFLDVPPSVGLKRLENRDEKNRLDNENLNFHETVYNGYKQIAKMYDKRIKVVDGTKSINEVFEEVKNIILRCLHS